jgi:lipid A disaccharide synthetase
VLVTEQGTVINIIPPEFQYESYQISDVAITLPGTNTAELAVLGIPMVVLMPLNKPEKIPAEGFFGILSNIPIFGKYLKKALIKQALKRIKFVSIPNQKLNRMIVPELIGNIHPVEAANTALNILEEPLSRRNISMNLKASMGSTGASKNIITNMVEILLKKYPDMEILEKRK